MRAAHPVVSRNPRRSATHAKLAPSRFADLSTLTVSHACLTVSERPRRPFTYTQPYSMSTSESLPLIPEWEPFAPTLPKQARFKRRGKTESPWVRQGSLRRLATVSPHQGPPPEDPSCLRDATEYIESSETAPHTGRRTEARPGRSGKGEMRCKNTDSWAQTRYPKFWECRSHMPTS